MVKILKASAGSGKTFRLAKTYISQLLSSDDPYAYRHILAVTFTNKATAEMKNRILRELDILAREPEKSGYIEDFVKMFGSAADIKKKAGSILTGILSDYGAFAVSTIDRFFQQAIRSFAREIGQFASYQVELDSDSLVKESVDRILEAVSEDNGMLLKWLTDSAMDQIIEKGKFSIEDGLYDIAKQLRSEEYKTMASRAGIDERVYSLDNLEKIKKGLAGYISGYEKEVRDGITLAVKVCREAGVEPEETNGKFLLKLEEKFADAGGKEGVPQFTDAMKRKCLDSSQWFTKTKTGLLSYVKDVLEGPLEAFADLFEVKYQSYKTAKLLQKQIYSFGIATEFYKEFEALVREKNVMTLDDSNSLLRKIIGESDAPFVYEKLGVRYDSFLLDEFQDTSILQWENFRPLLLESSSRGNPNLVVGDVKQSIYRWRNSDWRLLSEGVKNDFPDADDTEVMQDNWRSLKNIVDFNNSFFPFASDLLDARSGGGTPVSDVYGSVKQNIKCKEDDPGCLRFVFCQKERILEEVYETILDIVDCGGRYGEIAVLVRYNDTGSQVATMLNSYGIKVISDDSLKVSSSLTVRRLVSCLSAADRPEDMVKSYLSRELGLEPPRSWNSLVGLCEELLRQIRDKDESTFNEEILYVQSFMDNVKDWSAIGGNNLRAFLSHWDESEAKISSPQDPDAVRIMTVHKAKGLEFPYVIIPDSAGISLGRTAVRWCVPELSGTPLESMEGGAYRISLSDTGTSGTFFRDDYLVEKRLQLIDNINIFYVALTRPERGLFVIAPSPEGPLYDAIQDGAGEGKVSNFSEILYLYLKRHGAGEGIHTVPQEEGSDCEVFAKGEISPVTEKKEDMGIIPMAAEYPSWPLNSGPSGEDEDVRIRGRLKFSADSIDFFSGRPSPRMRGLLLHSMLSSVIAPSDLDAAVDDAVAGGDVPGDLAGEYKSLLERALSDPRVREWFPEERTMVRNEVSLMDSDGTVHRPDRVVVSGKSIIVIDFKSGEERGIYRRQVRRYMDIYRRMGYRDVRGYLWYLDREPLAADAIVEVN